MKKYNVFITKYYFLLNDYKTDIIEIETDDIYHVIGYIVCTSLERIKDIRYERILQKLT